MPGVLWEPSGQPVGADRSGGGSDAPVAADRQHIPDPLRFEFGTQLGVGSVDLISCHPAGRHSGSERAREHAGGQRGLGCEPDVVGDTGLGHPFGILVQQVGR
jgi:hypothetical protein